MAFHWLFFFSSIKVSNVSIALSCLGTSTLFAALLEPLIFKRKIDLSEIVMGIVIVICISLIFKVESQYKLGIIYTEIALKISRNRKFNGISLVVFLQFY